MYIRKNEILNSACPVGGKIRSLRSRLKLTLRETAIAAGISIPFLSQVERGLAFPSIASLTGIANALGVTVRCLVDAPREECTVSRGGQLRWLAFSDPAMRFARLANGDVVGQLDPMLVKMAPMQKRSKVDARAAQEFMYVIKGELSLTSRNEKFILKCGDSAHYESPTPYTLENAATIDSVFLWVGIR